MSTQSTLSFGNQGKLALHKIAQDKITDQSANNCDNEGMESKKRSLKEQVQETGETIIILDESPFPNGLATRSISCKVPSCSVAC